MPTTARDIPHPNQWPTIGRQERLIDALLDLILADDNPEEQAVWALEVIAGAVGLPVQVGSHDPLQQFQQFADATAGAFYSAGHDPTLRGELAVAAGKYASELASIAQEWLAPEQDADDESGLERAWWGPLARVSARRPSMP